ncbi:MAG: tetratricopeptide repeat protein [Deltaproteobacteria bacterium]|nr:tetratricopeptide repeat protein [Deltaproteobacteria bacterium]
MRDDDRRMVEALRRIGGKPHLAMATFFEEAERSPEAVLAKAADLSANLPEPITDVEGLLEVARSIAKDLISDAEEKEARREALKTIQTIEGLVEAAERMLYDGDFAGAREGFASAVAKTEAAFGSEAKELIAPLMGLARATGQGSMAAGGKLDEELALQRRAVKIAEDTLSEKDAIRAEVLHAHGVSVWAGGDASSGAELLERALEIAKRAGIDPSPFLAPLVGALLDAQRAGEAVPHARELLRLESGGGSPADLTTLFVVGQALRDAGAHDEARVVLQRFLDGYGESGNPEIREQVRGWIAALPVAKA